MTTFTFTDATRETAKARIAIQGPAGCGKTKTALRLAEGLAKNGVVALADTERGSAKKYAPVPGRPDLGGHRFKHVEMDTHDPRHLIDLVRQAEEIGVEVLIIDSYSHFWNGKGGLLEIVETAGAKAGSGGTFGGWRTGNPIEQQMLDAILNFRGHLIVTMRTKGDYVIEGKKVTKVGVKAVQREGAEYEFDVVMDMIEGTATVTKTRYTPSTASPSTTPERKSGRRSSTSSARASTRSRQSWTRRPPTNSPSTPFFSSPPMPPAATCASPVSFTPRAASRPRWTSCCGSAWAT